MSRNVEEAAVQSQMPADVRSRLDVRCLGATGQKVGLRTSLHHSNDRFCGLARYKIMDRKRLGGTGLTATLWIDADLAEAQNLSGLSRLGSNDRSGAEAYFHQAIPKQVGAGGA
jgi:hypothetical protein